MTQRTQIAIEGFSPDEILSMPDEQIKGLIFTGEPILFKAGTSEILGEFGLKPDTLVVELAQINGGGEGILPTLWMLARRYAKQQGLVQVEWIVYATNCAQPNLKLRRLLERKGFVIAEVPNKGEAYYFLDTVKQV